MHGHAMDVAMCSSATAVCSHPKILNDERIQYMDLLVETWPISSCSAERRLLQYEFIQAHGWVKLPAALFVHISLYDLP